MVRESSASSARFRSLCIARPVVARATLPHRACTKCDGPQGQICRAVCLDNRVLHARIIDRRLCSVHVLPLYAAAALTLFTSLFCPQQIGVPQNACKTREFLLRDAVGNDYTVTVRRCLAERNSTNLLSQTLVTDGHLPGNDGWQLGFGGEISRRAEYGNGHNDAAAAYSSQRRDRQWGTLNCQKEHIPLGLRSVKKLAQWVAKFHNYFWPRTIETGSNDCESSDSSDTLILQPSWRCNRAASSAPNFFGDVWPVFESVDS